MGDVLHNLAVVADLKRVFPGCTVDWCVEAAFSEIPRWNPDIRRVITVSTRTWKKEIFKKRTWREIKSSYLELRKDSYDAIIDTQGLFRSAVIGKCAIGPTFGQNWKECRDHLGGLLVDHPLQIPYSMHAVDRYRMIAATACGYEHRLSSLSLDFGLNSRFPLKPDGSVLMFCNTSREKKLWPMQNWIEVGKKLISLGYYPILTAGSLVEERRSLELIEAIGKGKVILQSSLTLLASTFANASLCLGVDTGFTHIASALRVPTVAIFTDTDPLLAGCFGPFQTTIGGRNACPSVQEVLNPLGSWK